MASTIWKGYISFGLISIPVRLFAAARGEHISFNQIHKVCGSRIKQQIFCPVCERVVERNELAKGYEVEKNRYVLIEDEEIKKIAPPSSDVMEILEFVKADEIDPIYFDASYFIVPEEAGRKAYQLLLETVEKSGYSALAKVSMHQREYTVVIRPHDKGLTLHTMYYPDEVREVPEYGRPAEVTLKPQEIHLAEQLVESLATSFEPSKYKDEYRGKLLQLIETKGEGKTMDGTPQRRLAPVIDLMQALQESLGKAPKRKPATSEISAKKPAETKRRTTKTVKTAHG